MGLRSWCASPRMTSSARAASPPLRPLKSPASSSPRNQSRPAPGLRVRREMEAKVQIERAVEPGGYVVRLYGTLDEGLERSALSGLKGAEAVLFDFEHMHRVTSFGV